MILEAPESKPSEIKMLGPNASTKGTISLNHPALGRQDSGLLRGGVMERRLSEDLKGTHPPAGI